MPAGGVPNPPWATGSWSATAWEANSWGSAKLWSFGAKVGASFLLGKPIVATGDTLLTDLLSYWSLEEAEGNTRVDSAGSAHMIETGGTVESAAGIQGQGASFPNDGLTSTVRYQPDTPSDYDLTGDFTLQCWVNQSVFIDRAGIFARFGGGSNRTFLFQGLVSGAIRFQSLMGGAVRTLDSNTITNINDWVHCVVTRDLATDSIKLYINGVFDKGLSGVGAITVGTAFMNIGHNTRDRVIGRVDECAIWTFSFSANDVTNLFNAGAGRAFSELGGIPRS